jgi:hypothetical protein
MGLCAEISANIDVDCTNPIQAGVEPLMNVIPRSTWLDASITYNGSNPQIIENVVFASGGTGYAYYGKKKSILAKAELIPGTFDENYKHEINAKGFTVTAAAKLQFERLAKQQVVVIIENKYKGAAGETAYEVYGADSGLELIQNIRDVNNAETGGAFDFILSSSEEKHFPKTFFITDLATTKAIVEGLFTPSV